MRRRAFLWTAAASCLSTSAATRPRYGGTLRVQLAGPAPTFAVKDARDRMRDRAFLHLVAETLTRVDVRGEAQPLLATSWRRDTAGKRWSFTLRQGVRFHDQAPVTPANVVTALKGSGEFSVVAHDTGVQITSNQPVPELPLLLANPSAAIIRDGATLTGTGPFALTARRSEGVLLKAFEQHWAGRAFLDAIELQAPHAGPYSVSNSDAWEMPLAAGARYPDGVRTWSSSPAELIAIDASAVDQNVSAALSAAIDRQSMASVLTQKQAEAAASLLPQWISGYALAFSIDRDLMRARRLLGGSRGGTLGLSYEAGDPLLRMIAERVAVNARDAGLVITTKPGAKPQLRIRRISVHPSASLALRSIAADISMSEHAHVELSNDSEAQYRAERRLIESGRLVPLMHVPLVFGFQPKVRGLVDDQYALPVLPLECAWMMP